MTRTTKEQRTKWRTIVGTGRSRHDYVSIDIFADLEDAERERDEWKAKYAALEIEHEGMQHGADLLRRRLSR